MSNNIIVKTAVKTALIILGVIIVAFTIFNIAFPQHVASVLEGMGSYGMAAKYANLRYTYTGDGYDLARCFDDSVLDGDDETIIKYGSELVSHSEFESVCERKNLQFGGRFDYRNRVYSSLTKSYYASGEADKAIEFALQDNGTDSFVYGNSLMVLAAKVCDISDTQTATKLIPVLEGITPASDEDKAYLSAVLQSLNDILVGG